MFCVAAHINFRCIILRYILVKMEKNLCLNLRSLRLSPYFPMHCFDTAVRYALWKHFGAAMHVKAFCKWAEMRRQWEDKENKRDTENRCREELQMEQRMTTKIRKQKKEKGRELERYGPLQRQYAGCFRLTVAISGSNAPPPQNICWSHSESQTWRQVNTNGTFTCVQTHAHKLHDTSVGVSGLTAGLRNKENWMKWWTECVAMVAFKILTNVSYFLF